MKVSQIVPSFDSKRPKKAGRVHTCTCNRGKRKLKIVEQKPFVIRTRAKIVISFTVTVWKLQVVSIFKTLKNNLN